MERIIGTMIAAIVHFLVGQLKGAELSDNANYSQMLHPLFSINMIV